MHVSSMRLCTLYLLCSYSTAVDCGPLIVPNGQVSTSSGTTFMNTATYTCDNGYNLIGVSDRTCQANGAWSLTAPTCDRECFKQTYTTVTELSVVYVNKLALTCLHTYVLLAVDCGSLNNIANGLVSTSSGTTFMMTATYTCNTAYNMLVVRAELVEQVEQVECGQENLQCATVRLTDIIIIVL